MNSLKEVFGAMQARDHEKVAAARAAAGLPPPPPNFDNVEPELLKQAQDYDQIGRILAHHVFYDLVKEAVDEAAPGASKEEKDKAVEEAMAIATGEKKPEKKDEEEKPKEGETAKEAAARVAKAKKKKAILAKMAQDPNYVSALVAKHYGR